MKVIGYGDNVVDRYVNRNVVYPGGNCINFAVYAKKAGVSSAYLGVFAPDAEAIQIKNALDSLGVEHSMCVTEPGSVTERCDVDIVDSNRVFRADDERPNLHGHLVLSQQHLDYLSTFDLIHMSCYAEQESEVNKLKDCKALVTFDFSDDDEFRSEEYLTDICPLLDFALFSCEGMNEEEIKLLLQRVHEYGASYVMATMGVSGQLLFDGTRFFNGVVHRVAAVDTMGAGDSFFTSFLMEMLKRGWKKGSRLDEEQLQHCFDHAAKFSADICMQNGAFGFGVSMK